MADSTATVIGPDTTIKGEITFNSRARLLGTVEGMITAKGDFEVAEGANCKASIEASKVTIDGMVEGNVTEGASFIGHCRIGSASSNGHARTVETKPEAKAEAPKVAAAAKK